MLDMKKWGDPMGICWNMLDDGGYNGRIYDLYDLYDRETAGFFRVSGEIHLSVVSPWLPPVRDRRSAPAFPPPSQRGHYPHPRPPDLERDRTELIR